MKTALFQVCCASFLLEDNMSIFQSVLLGILQGIAEFLPISSSGHLALAQHLFKLNDVPLLYDIILHLATLLAVVLFFRKKIWNLLCCFGRWIARRQEVSADNPEDLLCGNDTLGRKTIIAIICATFVTGILGVAASKLIPQLPLKFTCAGFIVTAGLLIFSSLWQKKQANVSSAEKKGIGALQALFVGFMQGIGTLPGISRSGSTIAGAQLAGIDRTSAGEFSFIVSIPAILGAFLLEAKDLGEMGSSVGVLPVVLGFVSAFIAGYISLAFLMKLIKKGRLEWFAAYLIPLGIAGLFCL